MSTQFKTGSASGADGADAGKKAARAALQQMSFGAKPDLCLIFGSPAYDLRHVLKGVLPLLPAGVQVVGSSFEPPSQGGEPAGEVVRVSLVATDEYRFLVKTSAWIKQEAAGAVRLLRTAFDRFLDGPGIDSFLMATDGSTDGREVTIAAIQAFRSDVHLSGGEGYPFCRGSGVIANDLVLSDAVSVCAVKGPRPFFKEFIQDHSAVRGPLTSARKEAAAVKSFASAGVFALGAS